MKEKFYRFFYWYGYGFGLYTNSKTLKNNFNKTKKNIGQEWWVWWHSSTNGIRITIIWLEEALRNIPQLLGKKPLKSWKTTNFLPWGPQQFSLKNQCFLINTPFKKFYKNFPWEVIEKIQFLSKDPSKNFSFKKSLKIHHACSGGPLNLFLNSTWIWFQKSYKIYKIKS